MVCLVIQVLSTGAAWSIDRGMGEVIKYGLIKMLNSGKEWKPWMVLTRVF